MTSEKRYGAERNAAQSCWFEGWTIDEIAENTHGGQPQHARELARDLIAAQARIAELERASDAVAVSNAVNEYALRADTLREQLAAAEATIARARNKIKNRRPPHPADPNRVEDIDDAIDRLSAELEAALTGPSEVK